MRLPRQVGGVLWLNFLLLNFMVKVHLLLIGTGSPWCNQVFFLPQPGPRKPLAPTGFSPVLLAGASPSLRSWCCLMIHVGSWRWDLVCTSSEGKPLCPDVLIPCGNPLHHTWPLMAGPDKVNDCCATEVTYVHWSLQCAHKRGPPPLLVQLNAFYLEICTIYVQFSPHTTKLH